MRLRILLAFVFAVACGCVTNPVPDMAVRELPDVQGSHSARLDYLSVVYDTGEPRAATGTANTVSGQTFAGFFKLALRDAIERSLIFTSDADTLLMLDVSILEDRHIVFSYDRELAVRYVIRDRSTGIVVFDKTIRTLGQTSMEYSLNGYENLRESEGRAVRQNIREFLVSLSKKKLDY